MKLSAWVPPAPSTYTKSENTLVRYPDPPDGRTWSLDATPRWVAMVSPCCGPSLDNPYRPFHYDWTVEHDGRRVGNSVRTTFEDARKEADAYMQKLGWELGAPAMNRDEWPQVGDEVDVDNGPKLKPGFTRGILLQLSIQDYGAQAYVVAFCAGHAVSRISCPVTALKKTGCVASPEEIREIRAEEDKDESTVYRLVAESSRLREYADVMDVLRKHHPEAMRTVQAWDAERKAS